MSVESPVPTDESERGGPRPQWAGEDPARGGLSGVEPGAGETRSSADRRVEPDEARPAETITEVAPERPEDDPFWRGDPSEVITEVAPDDPVEDDPYEPSEVITEVAPDDPDPEDPLIGPITEIAPETVPEDEAE